MIPTRLERNWDLIRPLILRKWEVLSDYDLMAVEGRFDRLVEVIRKRCMPTRSALSIEAEIKDWILNCIENLEK